MILVGMLHRTYKCALIMKTGLHVPAGYACAYRGVAARLVAAGNGSNVLIVIGLLFFQHMAFAQLAGSVFRDHDQNGRQTASAPTELGVAGIVVTAYVAGISQPVATTTLEDGSFAFTADQTPAGKWVRIEFSGMPLYTYDSPGDGQGGVQFVQAPASLNYGLSDPADYCQPQPLLITPVYQTGTTRTSASTLMSFPFIAEGQPTNSEELPGQLGTSANLGTVWATALQRQSNQLVSVSFLKRHADLGPLGLGGIYVTNPTAATSVAYFDAGQYLTLASPADLGALATRTFPESFSLANIDADAFRLVGKAGLGGATFTPREDQLWVVNLHEKTLVRINTGAPLRPASQLTPDAFTSYTIPQSFTAGVSRPWAVAYHLGKLYVGVVNDASVSRLRADLKACVYAFDLTTNTFNPTPVLNVPLNYRKGWAVTDATSSLGEYWEPWSDTWSDFATNSLSTSSTPQIQRVVRPQPILSSIGFDAEGAMLIGLMDRTGHQTSRNQPAPTETSPSPTTVYSGYTGGDLLRAAMVYGTYQLEGNGSVGIGAGAHSGCGVGNGQGPADNTSSMGEFYCHDQYGAFNQETFAGSLLSNPSLDNLIVNLFNPLTTWSGGTAFFDTYTGDLIRRYEVYRDAVSDVFTAPRSTFGASNGLGQVNALCQPAPVRIGNRVWVDANKDGVQGPDELPLGGVLMSLYTATGKWLATTTSNEQGLYSFQSGPGLILSYNTPYYVAVGVDRTSSQYDKTSNVLQVGTRRFILTGWNQGIGASPDRNDSDAIILSGSGTALNGLPVMQFQVGLPGQSLNSLDLGVQEAPPCEQQTCLTISARRIR